MIFIDCVVVSFDLVITVMIHYQLKTHHILCDSILIFILSIFLRATYIHIINAKLSDDKTHKCGNMSGFVRKSTL